MALKPNKLKYFRSLAEELLCQSQRVRYLIGDKHWLSDGHHKEYILTSLLKRFLPTNVEISRGFIVSPMEPEDCSKEQDILIVNTSYSTPLFNQSGLIITLPDTVLASISVKSTMRNDTLKDTVENLQSVRTIMNSHCLEVPPQVLCAGYFFDTYKDFKHPENVYGYYDSIMKQLCSNPTCIPVADILCCNKDFYYNIHPDDSGITIKGYNCMGLATAVFLAHVVDHVSSILSGNVSKLTDMVDSPEIEQLNPPCHKINLSTSS